MKLSQLALAVAALAGLSASAWAQQGMYGYPSGAMSSAYAGGPQASSYGLVFGKCAYGHGVYVDPPATVQFTLTAFGMN